MPNQYRQGKRRRMTKFELGEISFVDNPAQTPALAEIQKMDDICKLKPKRDESEDDFVNRFLESDDMKESTRSRRIAAARNTFRRARTEKRGDLVTMLSGSSEGHQHGIQIHGDSDGLYFTVFFAAAEGGEMHDHQVVRTPDGQYVMSENRGHSHDIDQEGLLQTLLSVMAKSEQENSDWNDVPLKLEGVSLADLPEIQKASETEKEDSMSDAEKKLKEQFDALKAENERLSKIAGLSAAHKAHYDSLSPELEDDDRAAFLDASVDKRNEIVAKAETAAKDADPVVYTSEDGAVYRKSDDPRLVKMAQDRDEDRKEAILLRKASEDQALTKRAEDELANFPGEVSVRKAILKAVDGIKDEDVRSKAIDALKAQNARLAESFKVVGTSGQPSVEKAGDAKAAADQLDALAKKRSEETGENHFDAYEKVSEENPELTAKAIAG